jgi:TPR repeat protein
MNGFVKIVMDSIKLELVISYGIKLIIIHLFYAKGDGVSQDLTKAEEYKRMATDMQDQIVKQFNSIRFEEGA